jgi:dTDP-4-amino-4,6-dideoxygalactose transaminase
MKIPFNKPFIAGKELYYIARAVLEDKQLAGDGYYTKKCHKWLENNLHCHKTLLTNSCTAALEMTAILCDFKPGDEVIMPSYTFVSTANAFVLRGGVPVFIDIRPDTLNIDETKIEQAITIKTKAVVAVHYAGVACEMDRIMNIAKKHKLIVIEDSAQSLLSSYKDKYLGTIGDFGTLSFHETKNVISGEGGALLINNNKFIERAEIIWEKGTDRKRFFRGEVDKYSWIDIGSSFLPGELTAAFLFAQLEMSDKIIRKRCDIYNHYYSLLEPLTQQQKITLPFIDKSVAYETTSNGHIFYIITKSLKERTELIEHLKNHNIHSVFHYNPLHLSTAGKKFGKISGDLIHTEDLSQRVLRLPMFYGMRNHEVEHVVTTIKHFYDN